MLNKTFKKGSTNGPNQTYASHKTHIGVQLLRYKLHQNTKEQTNFSVAEERKILQIQIQSININTKPHKAGLMKWSLRTQAPPIRRLTIVTTNIW